MSFISTHPPREGRDIVGELGRDSSAAISTHPPREGRDVGHAAVPATDNSDFNPPAP